MTRAFSLIELLVTVAIIAILAAIAIPNLLAAQTRSKVSRVKADLRTLKTALEAYAADENAYPRGSGGLGFTGNLLNLIAPRPYLTTVPHDVFLGEASYFYASIGAGENPFGSYVLASVGPDRRHDTTFTETTSYDPTNGTVSRGDIVAPHRTGI